MMKLNKEKFLKTELGEELKYCITAWDKALEKCRKTRWGTEEHSQSRKVADRCQARWEVYQMVLKQFYGTEYYFSRTDDYFGVVTQDEADWLFKVEKQETSST